MEMSETTVEILAGVAVLAGALALRFSVWLGWTVWLSRGRLWSEVKSRYKASHELRRIAWSIPLSAVLAFALFHSNPIIFAGFIVGGSALAIKAVRIGIASRGYLHGVVLATTICIGLTFGGMLHDLAFPATARCSDGTYSSSAHHRGTCSWHGGVSQWSPDPWWQAVFE